ncbi:PIG-L family deacetylase [Streptomyces sp. NBC_00264]|uniref:PIG-L deacetylase family protein n=1 Tax=unclassified Streptomyces TaxID=2593676 RepID=UPI000F5B9DB5|nr:MULTISPECIES: PIG-L deacetylase family protein [unclassified Streptomyces]WSG55091.1 PIG-L family deacetylase [Streptomyces sp. NBC_01732]WSX05807.1 PIG-L family deacetylase [Streptomyces sp. NBC_00987]MCX4391936.1 PIG-L family deacetylase [Streptomyces sp. NBC_01767]MCX5104060.1 PIG-L family deacetylase [Streptomyces sp. NBC_00439]MCX5164890.1 PIG-L family deacetylase [Streptomyces sp. NBC_00305]
MTEQLEPMPTDWRRALAVVAHPDDLEYGCAAAIAGWTDEGREVAYLLATRGEAGIGTLEPEKCAPLREREQRASAAVVGVSGVEFLDHRDGVIEYGLPLRRDIAAAIRKCRPELVITLNHRDTWGGVAWNTPDHRAVGRATLDAVADAGNRWIFPELAESGLRPWNGVRWVAVAGSDAPTHAVDATAGLERSVKSLLAHRTYIEALTDEDPEAYCRTFLTDHARAEGERFGGRPAVTFELFTR